MLPDQDISKESKVSGERMMFCKAFFYIYFIQVGYLIKNLNSISINLYYYLT